MTIAAFLNTKLAYLKRHYFPELITLFVVFGVVGVFVSIYAGQRSNLPIPYQGRLLDSNYIPVADGTHYMEFGIYDSATGGNCLWRTEQPGSGVGCSGTATSTPVTVNRGIFTAYLGNGDSTNDEITSSITNNFNSGTYYLGITACGTANSCDAEMTPRRQIGGVPYAYNADFLDGLDSSSFGVFTGVAGGQTIIGGTAANNKLTFMGTSASGNTAATSSIIFLVGDTGSTTAATILNNGFLGIGTTTPSSLLTIGGNTITQPPSLTGTFFSFASSTVTDTGTVTGGTLTNTAFLSIGQGVLTSTNNTTSTNAYSLYLAGAPVKGANTTSTNAIALGIGAGAVGTQVNSYGLYANAQTGAANNYAATFMGGNVGIGTSTPTSLLSMVSTTATVQPFNKGLVTVNSTVSSTDSAGSAAALYLSTTNSNSTNGNTIYGSYNSVSDDVTLANTDYGSYINVGNTGGAQTGVTARTVYGEYINTSAAGASSTATTNAYGLYVNTLAAHGTDYGTVNGYGIYIANNAGTTAGTSTRYGLFIAEQTGADNNYTAIFAGGNVGIGTSTPQALLTIVGALSGTPSSSTGAYFTFATSTYTDTGTASGGTASSSSFITFNQSALASTNNVTTTDAYTLFIAGGPVKGANNTSTNAIALGIGAGAVGTQVNSYGLYVNAQTGATNNYGAVFASGFVGIGTTTPSSALNVRNTNSNYGQLRIIHPTTNGEASIGYRDDSDIDNTSWVVGKNMGAATDDSFAWYYNGTKMTIDTSGNVGIGTTQPDLESLGSNYKILTVYDGTSQYPGTLILATVTSTSVNAEMGRIHFLNGGKRVAQIVVQPDSVASDDGFMAFSTMNSGTLGERLRIDSAGYVGVGTTTPTQLLTVGNIGADTGSVVIGDLSTAGSDTVSVDSAGKLYRTTSDRRLKKNISSLSDGLDILGSLSNLRGVYYNWNTDLAAARDMGNQREIGMVAQEVERILPELVGMNNLGYRTLKYDKMTAFLVEALKAQQNEIAPLKKLISMSPDFSGNFLLSINKDGGVGIGFGTSTPSAALDVRQQKNVDDGIGGEVFGLSSAVTKGDMPNYKVSQGKSLTSSSTQSSTINQITVASSTLYSIEARILQRDEQGNGGSYILKGTFKTSTTTPPILTLMSSSTEVLFRDNASSTPFFDTSSPGSMKLNVSSLANISTSTWHSTVFVSTIGK